MPSPADLIGSMTRFVVDQLEVVMHRHLPDGRLPQRFAGFPVHPWTIGDLIEVLSLLPELGVYAVADRDVEEWIETLLPQVDPEGCSCFASYRIAEAIGRFGAWAGNPVLDDLNEADLQRALRAIDSSGIIDEGGKPLGGRPKNYWAVLARCEVAREHLGVLEDREVLERALTEVSGLLAANPSGFIDDSADGSGRYDIYSADVLCFLEPLFDRLDRAVLDHAMTVHREQLELGVQANGASHVWGRSTGLLAVMMTMELSSLLLAEERAPQPERQVGMIAEAFKAQQNWWREGLVTAHRSGMTYGYRGPHRLLQMSLDCLGKLLGVANRLRGLQSACSGIASERWRPLELDRLVTMDERGAGVWYYRHGRLDFQLPLVSGGRADYLPIPMQPGLFEVPVDSDLIPILPVVGIGAQLWTPGGVPAEIHKTPGILTLRYDRLQVAGGTESCPAAVHLVYRANGEALTLQADIQADGITDASVMVGEVPGAPLVVAVGDQRVDQVSVDGLPDWRSYWGPFTQVHQAELPVRNGRVEMALRIASDVDTSLT